VILGIDRILGNERSKRRRESFPVSTAAFDAHRQDHLHPQDPINALDQTLGSEKPIRRHGILAGLGTR
jgi:hypothetical protein